MPDTRFFDVKGPFSLGELAEFPDIELAQDADPELKIQDVKPLDLAGEGDLTFLSNPKYADAFLETKATACIATTKALDLKPEGMSLLLAKDPYKAFARVASLFYPANVGDGVIAKTAEISETAQLGDNVSVGSYTVIEEGVEIGENSIIGSHCVLKKGIKLGSGCRLGESVTLSHCYIGDNVSIYNGARIGQDGFGFAPDAAGNIKIPQLGRVIIGSNVEIGANTTIDRGAGPDTQIGDNTWIDNLVQIGHNVVIGKGCIIVSQTGISGSTVLEDYVVLGGQVGLAGHLKLGTGSQVTAKSGVMTDIPPGEIYGGIPAQPRRQWFQETAILRRLVKSKGKKS